MATKNDTPRLDPMTNKKPPENPDHLKGHTDDDPVSTSQGNDPMSSREAPNEMKGNSPEEGILPSPSVSLDSNLRDVEGVSPGNNSQEQNTSESNVVSNREKENRAKSNLVPPKQESHNDQQSLSTDKQRSSRRQDSDDEGIDKSASGDNGTAQGSRAYSSVHEDPEDTDSVNQTEDTVPSMAVRVDRKSSATSEEAVPVLHENVSCPALMQSNQSQIARLPSPKQGAHGQSKGSLGNMLSRGRIPPKLIRLATVTVATRTRTPRTERHGPSLYYLEPHKKQKVISWDAANNARPPLRIDMEGPGPCSYSPRNKPLYESNAPSFTFGSKCYPEKEGGSRTSWEKSWFQSPHIWTNKTDFNSDGTWPEPSTYKKTSLIGPRQRTATEAPSFTIGRRNETITLSKPGSHKEPSPGEYDRHLADNLILTRQPAFTHQFRHNGTVLWGLSEKTPGPAAYSPKLAPSRFRSSFTIRGVRREKSQILGPFATL